MNKHTKLAVVSSLLAGLLSLTAPAAVYPFNFNDAGPIPQGGTVLSVEQTIGGIEHVIGGVQLILTFNDSASLPGGIGGIQGLLTLGTGTGSPFVSFDPTAGTPGSGAQRIFDATFSGFNSLDPNNTWALVLWDNSTSGIENGLVSWSLNITAVPEPVTKALGAFAGIFLGVITMRHHRSRFRPGN